MYTVHLGETKLQLSATNQIRPLPTKSQFLNNSPCVATTACFGVKPGRNTKWNIVQILNVLFCHYSAYHGDTINFSVYDMDGNGQNKDGNGGW